MVIAKVVDARVAQETVEHSRPGHCGTAFQFLSFPSAFGSPSVGGTDPTAHSNSYLRSCELDSVAIGCLLFSSDCAIGDPDCENLKAIPCAPPPTHL